MRGHPKTLSCPPCRERKVKCDRLTPCKSCVRHGCEAHCRPYNTLRDPRAPAALPISRLAAAGNRSPADIGQTSMAEDTRGSTSQPRLGEDDNGDGTSPQGLSALNTPRSGGGHPCSWQVTRTTEGPSFTVESLHDHIKLQTLRGNNCDCRQAPTIASFGTRLSVSDSNAWNVYLASQLPTHAQCDLLVSFFFESVNWTYQCIHAPSFRRQQQTFWSASVTDIDAIWLALLYIIMCLSALHIDLNACAALDMDASRIRGLAHDWFRLSRQALHAGQYEAKPCLTQLQVFIESQIYWYAVKGVDSLNS